jgi:hypothetical protein
MRFAIVSFIILPLSVSPALADKLTFEEKTELVRGLMAEYATVKVALPRSKKPLEIATSGSYEKSQWADAMQQNGPAARAGDLVEITKVDIENNRIVLEINNGIKGKHRWWHNVQIGMGSQTSPVVNDQNSNAPSGTSVALVFDKPLQGVKAADVKKMLQPVLDFEKRTAAQNYVESLPKEIQDAIKAKKVLVGMDRDMVLLAKGRPESKLRESKEGIETEDWIYGKSPGTITFVTFEGNKVIRVKEAYAAAN